MKFLLKGEGVWKLVNPEPQEANAANATVRTQGARTRTTQSPTLQHPPTEAYEQRSSKAAYLIYQSCSAIPQSHIADEEDPATMWSILEDLFSRVNEDDEAGKALYEEFLAEQFQNYKSVDEYAAKLRNYQSKLANIMEKRLTDRSLTQQLIKGLLYQYDDIVTPIRANKSKFRQAIKMLNERERTFSSRKQSKALIAPGASHAGAPNAGAPTSHNYNHNRNHGSYRGNNHRGGKPHWDNYRGEPYHRKDRDRSSYCSSCGHERNPGRYCSSCAHENDRQSHHVKEYDICTYCGLSGHPEKDCFIRKRAKKRITEAMDRGQGHTSYSVNVNTAIATAADIDHETDTPNITFHGDS